MIYVHSMERALRYHPQHPAWCLGQNRLSFRELHEQVKRLAATLTHLGFEPGDRLALLLPNGLDYIKFVYACSWLGVIVVPINVRLSVCRDQSRVGKCLSARIGTAFLLAGAHCSSSLGAGVGSTDSEPG